MGRQADSGIESVPPAGIPAGMEYERCDARGLSLFCEKEDI